MKINIENIHIEEYNYELQEEHIAKFPLSERDSSKLLVYHNGMVRENVFKNISDHLPDNSLLVFNNTKVIQARLVFKKETGAQIEIFCLEPRFPSDYAQSFGQTSTCTWLCMVGNAKKWKQGILKIRNPEFSLYAERLEAYGESNLIRFSWDNPDMSFAEILDVCGELPIPPYLNRKTTDSDKNTYQTVYSKIKGSVAAPTAGLHFTGNTFEKLKEKGITCEELTLHVGAGTFKPVKSETINEHQMHTEFFTFTKHLVELLLKNDRMIIAVGTTSVRSLESIYYLGVKLLMNPDMEEDDLIVDQWMPYSELNSDIPVERAVNAVYEYMIKKDVSLLHCHTQIMIVPGYDFKIVKGIITNFHQPKSTLLLLISAFVKGDWKIIYDYALENNFRFLSYGDSSLLL